MSDVVSSDDGARVGVRVEVPRTSLMSPRVRPLAVDRSGVLAEIVADDSVFCVVVRAPAGYGKSTLLAQWCGRADAGRVAWFTVDEYHDDPVSFWSGLAAAIDRVAPGFGGSFLHLLHRPGTNLLDSVMPRLVNEIVGLAEPVTVVLDDLHTVTNTATLDGLGWMLGQLPTNLRVLIGTRTEPAVSLARLQAAGHVVEVDVARLAFDRDEAAAMLRAMCPELSDDHVDVAVTKTEGWPTGLAAIGMALSGGADPDTFLASFDGRDRTIDQYLVEEVLGPLPAADQRWLQLTSVLDVLTPESCDAVTETTGAAGRLHTLAESNALLIGLDRHGATYRYHHLFGEFLQQRLLLTDPDAHTAAHRRACQWHRDHHQPEAAFNHALHANDTHLAATIAAESGFGLIDSGRTHTVRHQLRQLGDTTIADHPDLALLAAYISGIEPDDRTPIDVPYYLHLAEANIARAAHEAGLRASIETVGILFAFVGVGRVRELGQRAPGSTMPQGRLVALTMANYFAGHPADAARFAQRAIDGARGSGWFASAERAMAIAYLANIAIDDGQLDRARSLADEAMSICESHDMAELPAQAIVHITRGRVFALLGELDRGEAMLRHGVLRAPSWSTVRIFGCLELTRVALHRGDQVAALRHLDEVAATVESHEDPGWLAKEHRRLRRLVMDAASTTESEAPQLTEREIELLELLGTDLTNREIAARLYISHNTVKSHLRVIYQKLGAASRADAVATAADLGLAFGPGDDPAPSPG